MILICVPEHPNPQFDRARSERAIHNLRGSFDLIFLRGRSLEDNLNRAREIILECGYEALLVIEHDIVPPSDALLKLGRWDLQIVSGLYRLQGGALAAFWWDERHKALESVPEDLQDPLVQVYAVGFGCLFVKRKVLEKIMFKDPLKTKVGSDVQFCRDAQSLGFKVWCDTSVWCEHLERRF